MPRRGENIRKRGDGRWEARYPKGKNQMGRTSYGSVYGATYREVKRKRQQLLEQNVSSTARPCGDQKFGDILRRWEESNQVRLKASTTYRYHYLIETHIMPELGNWSASKITGDVINAFLAEKLQNGRKDGNGGLSAAYVRSIMLVINAALRFGATVGVCPPLTTQIHKPPQPRKELFVLSKEHQAVLEEALLSDMDGTKLGVYISLYTGLRIGEICALTWKDVDLKDKVISVRHTVVRVKNDGGSSGTRLILDRPKTPASLRSIPICSNLLRVLNEHENPVSAGFVISGSDDFVSPRTFAYRYGKLLEANHIPHFNYHALRHTFATRCIEAGVDVKSLSEILGHANAAITLNTYVHSSMELKRAQLEKLNEALA